ncbi:hypothetical protein GOP47_0021196 [Adiantum capillus-veneris]|uniref:Exostosin GT47 domain-containing protein n=1 Tax=Adiantum capillus-veneris TaxID=13818 RepID=A0A9D4Z9F6_ADICA|nr:hypothetical protein GOP47_0021196 [Adiantum capillus-veneris]
MNGAARLPKLSTELADAPGSISISKGPWWKYSYSAPKASPPPRLLLAFLLLAQVLFLAIVRLGPGGFLWTLSSSDGLPSSSSTPMHTARPFIDVPQRVEESSVSKESSTSLPSSVSSSTRSKSDIDAGTMTYAEETPLHTESTSDRAGRGDADVDSLSSTASSTGNLNADKAMTSQVDKVESMSDAAAMITSLDVAKQEQVLIAEKVFENQRNTEHDGKQHSAHELLTRESAIPPASDMLNPSNKDEKTILPVEEHGELADSGTLNDAVNVKTGDKEVGSSSECSYGYVYVYDLPPMYNQDIVANCTALNVYTDMCDTLLNNGLGPSLGDASPLGQVGSWFRSDQFTAEIVFHKRMLQHPCLTDKQEQANSFYVPYYVGLDVGRYLFEGFSAEERDRVSNHVLEWLVQQPGYKRNGGWGHFLMVGRITWDFRRSKVEDWGSGFFYHPSMQNVTRLLIEKNPWDYMEMAVPYPTNFHPQSDGDLVAWQNHIRGLQRTSLFAFAGAPRRMFPNDFRGILLDQCQEAQSCRALDCSNRTCENNQRTLELFMDSKFCLQPRGDSFTRRSTFDCLLAGSIPVFFWHRTAYMQYKWHLPENGRSYSVFISKEAMRNGTRIEDVLKSYVPEKVREMQEVVIGLIPKIVYALSGTAMEKNMDAFDVAIGGVMKRFKEELHLSSQR